MTEDRELSSEEVVARKLPAGGCCCSNHGHRWYERTEDDDVWIECYYCSETK